jgi:hypothetical protein
VSIAYLLNPIRELTWSRDRIPYFIGQLGLTRKNLKKLKFNISYEKIYVNIDYTYYEV